MLLLLHVVLRHCCQWHVERVRQEFRVKGSGRRCGSGGAARGRWSSRSWVCCLGYQAARGDIFCPHSRVSLPRNTPVAPTHEEPCRKKPPCIMLQAPSSTSTTKENRHCMLDQGRATCISSPMPLPLCSSCGSSRSFRDCLPHHFYHIHTHTHTHTLSLSPSLSLSLSLPLSLSFPKLSTSPGESKQQLTIPRVPQAVRSRPV